MKKTSPFYMAEYKSRELYSKNKKIDDQTKFNLDYLSESKLYSIILPPNWDKNRKNNNNIGQKSSPK